MYVVQDSVRCKSDAFCESVWSFVLETISLPHVCLYVCLCVHETAEPLDGVHELPDTQTAQQTDVIETYLPDEQLALEFDLMPAVDIVFQP